MARQPRDNKDKENVTTLANSPLEEIPETHGMMTSEAEKVMAAPAQKAPAKALEQQATQEAPAVKYYRVTAPARIQGSTGFRARMNPGKVLSTTTYNIERLKNQGVQMVEITEREARAG